MSEYQFVHFLALDTPLGDKQLEFMRRQSTRAEITQWDFTNEYHYGDFHGDAEEMLRRGYDVHLHFANFGTRRLLIRLAAGLPCDRRTFNAFCVEYGVGWDKDKKGPGGILEIAPEADAGSYDYLLHVDSLLPELAPIRDMLIAGDLRPLYLAWLACQTDEDALEPPVPAGLGMLPKPLARMADLYELSADLISAAAERSPPMSKSAGDADPLGQWIAGQPEKELRQWMKQLLSEDAAAARGKILAKVRKETSTQPWPMAEPSRTLGELRGAMDSHHEKRLQKEKLASDAARRNRLKQLAADPDKAIRHVESLVQQRSGASYDEAAAALADLREALGPEAGPKRTRAVAERLRREHPTLRMLIGALKRKGLLE